MPMAQAPAQQQVVPFTAATRRNYQKGTTVQGPTQTGATYLQTLQLPHTGFLANIYLLLTLTVTTGGAGTYAANTTLGGSGAPGYNPWSILQNLRFYLNNNTTLHNVSGWGLYLVSRNIEEPLDPANPFTSLRNTTVSAQIYSNPTSFSTSTQYTFKAFLRVPVCMGDNLATGMLLLSSQTTYAYLDLTFQDPAQIIVPTGGTLTVNAYNIVPYYEFYDAPNNPQSWPAQGYYMQISESIDTLSGNGTYTWRPAPGPILANVIQEFVPTSSSTDGLTVANMGLSTVQYAQSQTPENVDALFYCYLQRERYGNMDLPDGVIHHSFSAAVSSNVPDSLAMYDTSKLTDYAILTQLNSGISAGGFARTVRRQLVAQAG